MKKTLALVAVSILIAMSAAPAEAARRKPVHMRAASAFFVPLFLGVCY